MNREDSRIRKGKQAAGGEERARGGEKRGKGDGSEGGRKMTMAAADGRRRKKEWRATSKASSELGQNP